MSTNTSINQIYKSRKTILELLYSSGYYVDDYVDFTVNEVDAMFAGGQLDMILEHPTTIFLKKVIHVSHLLQP